MDTNRSSLGESSRETTELVDSRLTFLNNSQMFEVKDNVGQNTTSLLAGC